MFEIWYECGRFGAVHLAVDGVAQARLMWDTLAEAGFHMLNQRP